MQFKLTFKTPNATDAIDDQLDAEYNCDSEERQLLRVVMKEVAAQFVEYDEYVVIEFDTETRTAKVLSLKDR